ncbi:Sps1p [Rhizophagus irregularis DAOM 197198w]|uniref:Sps1p n=1 Tax=Rhizophagus irregularis (strain DAOM 197198w) TaxID=1432141 RepID=A0A015KH13_RHIIW|nr:Sps1p [Rhizophagus irregularis DAOM 197198w]
MKTLIKERVRWVPYSQIKNLEKIAEGGFGTVYKAIWNNEPVAVKRFSNSQNISKYFLNELKSLYHTSNFFVIDCRGITQDPVTEDYMIIMTYANGGNLHDYLQKNFVNITWHNKVVILWDISNGLKAIHENNFIHRDFHSGNILLSIGQDWKIGDLGLSQPAENTSLNNEIYGVIPYIAPEIFKGGKFSKESDIYSLGMIMWELTTGCKPFADVEHNINLIYEIIDGKRPEITNDTPEWFANLMKQCWNSVPSKRPTIYEFRVTIGECYNFTKEFPFQFNKFTEMFVQAEKKRLELIQSKKLGPEFSQKSHPKAIFTSRALSSLISKSLTINSSTIIRNMKQEYITKENDFDINTTQRLSSSNIQLNNQHSNAIYTTSKLLISKPISTVNSSRKRNIEELKIETQNIGKRIKIDN